MAPTLNEIVRNEVDRMLATEIINPVESVLTPQVVIPIKKDGSNRFCVDYRKLNSVMHADRWPLPRLDEIFYDMNGSIVFTTIDLLQIYWQIKMDETYKEKAAFICPYINIQFEVMPFCSMYSQARCQRMINRIIL